MAIDLGASFTHLAVPEAGVVVREPTMVAFAPQGRRPLAVGREARAREELSARSPAPSVRLSLLLVRLCLPLRAIL